MVNKIIPLVILEADNEKNKLFINTLNDFQRFMGQRIKDIAYFKGINSEQLIGYGLIVGLSGSWR